MDRHATASVHSGDPLPGDAGAYTFTVTAQDAAGNEATEERRYEVESATVTITVVVANPAPGFGIQLPDGTTCADARCPVTVKGDASVTFTAVSAQGPDQAKWSEVIDVNLGGVFNMAKAVFEGMAGRGYGRIVNIGSINGQAGQYGQVNYAAAKSGIHGFTKALAQEGARSGVTVNAIAPGYIDTDMVAAVPEDVLAKIVARIPVNRLGQASEIARGVGFLVAEDAGFITGSTLSINGGQHMY